MRDLKIKERWSNLSLREKRIVTAGSIAAFILLFYLLIWAPISNKAASLRTQIEKDAKLLSWMQAADNRIQILQQSLHPSSSISSKSMLSIIQNEINQPGFAKNLSALRQVDNHSVQINLQNVPFDGLINWLTQLSKSNGLQVTQMAVAPTTTSGLVTAEIILKG